MIVFSLPLSLSYRLVVPSAFHVSSSKGKRSSQSFCVHYRKKQNFIRQKMTSSRCRRVTILDHQVIRSNKQRQEKGNKQLQDVFCRLAVHERCHNLTKTSSTLSGTSSSRFHSSYFLHGVHGNESGKIRAYFTVSRRGPSAS
jgi:hypothetical protein